MEEQNTFMINELIKYQNEGHSKESCEGFMLGIQKSADNNRKYTLSEVTQAVNHWAMMKISEEQVLKYIKYYDKK